MSKPFYQDNFSALYRGNNLHIMPEFENNWIDTIITDPPYALEFMGKAWDKVLPARETWVECLRVAKPGAMMLVFGGDRTHHRLMVDIEDAGWEIRTCIYWLFGSGFPKSLDIGKAIDKQGGDAGIAIRNEIAILIKSSGMSDNQIADITGVSAALVRFWRKRERNIMAKEANRLCDMLRCSVPMQVEREITGNGPYHNPNARQNWGSEGYKRNQILTAPATPEAQLWDGWGTALKPATEIIVVAMKPLDGTFAENALKHGVAGLNIDGGRIDYQSENDKEKALAGDAFKRKDFSDKGWSRPWMEDAKRVARMNIEAKARAQKGRWPSNLLLSHHPECREIGVKKIKGDKREGKIPHQPPGQYGIYGDFKGTNNKTPAYGNPDGTETIPAYECHPDCAVKMLDEQVGELKSGLILPHHGGRGHSIIGTFETRDRKGEIRPSYGDKGNASRFFYCAKASRSERGEDNKHPTVKPLKLMEYLVKLTMTPTGGVVLDPFAGSCTTGLACKNVGRKCILIEKDDCEIGARRLSQEVIEWE